MNKRRLSLGRTCFGNHVEWSYIEPGPGNTNARNRSSGLLDVWHGLCPTKEFREVLQLSALLYGRASTATASLMRLFIG